ncbi:MAG: DUF1292 domain-containing protein [Caldicoprobacterales bacterium]|jgi:hypothetical protein|nr:DUF1292 domain-containing protein [Clostridiales bacterium]
MDERDILVFADENGQEIQMEILDYFEYDGELYAMLIEAEEYEHEHEHEHQQEHDEESNIYIMKVIVKKDENMEEFEEFVPVEEDKMDELIEVIQNMYDEDGEYDDDGLYDDDSEDPGDGEQRSQELSH